MSKKNVTTTGGDYADWQRQRSTQTTWDDRQTRRDYDPASLEQYRQLQPQIGKTLGDFMGDPWKSGYFQQALGRSQEQIGQMGRTNLQGVLNLAGQSGLGTSGMPAYLASEAGRVQRGTQRMQSNALTDLLLGAGQARLQAAGMAQGYNPLETGQTQTGRTQTDMEADTQRSGRSSQTQTQQQKGGWLAPLIGAGVGAVTGGLGWLPGISGGFSGIMSGGLGGSMSNPSMFSKNSSPYIPAMSNIGLPGPGYQLGGYNPYTERGY